MSESLWWLKVEPIPSQRQLRLSQAGISMHPLLLPALFCWGTAATVPCSDAPRIHTLLMGFLSLGNWSFFFLSSWYLTVLPVSWVTHYKSLLSRLRWIKDFVAEDKLKSWRLKKKPFLGQNKVITFWGAGTRLFKADQSIILDHKWKKLSFKFGAV